MASADSGDNAPSPAIASPFSPHGEFVPNTRRVSAEVTIAAVTNAAYNGAHVLVACSTMPLVSYYRQLIAEGLPIIVDTIQGSFRIPIDMNATYHVPQSLRAFEMIVIDGICDTDEYQWICIRHAFIALEAGPFIAFTNHGQLTRLDIRDMSEAYRSTSRNLFDSSQDSIGEGTLGTQDTSAGEITLGTHDTSTGDVTLGTHDTSSDRVSGNDDEGNRDDHEDDGFQDDVSNDDL